MINLQIRKITYNRILSGILILIFALSLAFQGNVFAEEKDDYIIFHEVVESQPVSQSVEYDRYIRFDNNGWLTIHVLKIDISDRETNIDTLVSNNGIRTGETVTSMSSQEGLIGVINADFFNLSGNRFTLGPIVQSGNFISSPSTNENLAVFSINNKNIPSIEKWIWEGNLIISENEKLPIASINKGSNSNNIVMFTKEWDEKTPISASNRIELEVVNNRVASIQEGNGGSTIPKDGYILSLPYKYKEIIEDNFRIGKNIEIKLNSEPNWSNIKAAVGGGGVILKDGEIPAFDHNIAGNHPRTAIGYSKDSKAIYKVVVEGRHGQSRGISQTNLAEFMLSIGAYNALNLDGGGSSAMTVRNIGKEFPSLVSKPSQSIERRIPVALGVFTDTSPKRLSGLKVTASQDKLHLDGRVKLQVKGFDNNYNPVQINENRIVWEVKDNLGYIKDSYFYGEKSGLETITARIGRISGETRVHILEEGWKLDVSPSSINLKHGESIAFDSFLVDIEGFKAPINADEVNWISTENIGEFDGKIFTASDSVSKGLIIAEFNGLKGVSLVSVGEEEGLIDDFQKIEGKTPLTFPKENVKAEYEIAETPKFLFNDFVGKLSYELNGDSLPQAAYILYEDDTVLPYNTTKLGLWVYGNESEHWLRGMATDARGNDHLLTFSRYIDWKGWKRVEAQIPNNLPQPLKLKRVYIAETDSEKLDEGKIYFENLTAFSPTKFDYDLLEEIEIPNYPEGKENDNKIESDYSFIAFGDALIESQYNPEYHKIIRSLSNKSNNKDVVNIFAGDFTIDDSISPFNATQTWLSSFRNPIYPVSNTYYSASSRNNSYIFLDISKGGLRSSCINQWLWFKKELENSRRDNLIITLKSSPEGFTDSYEKQLLYELLTEHKLKWDSNVYIIFGNTSELIRDKVNGISIIGLPGVAGDNLMYALFTVENGKLKYQIKNL